MRRVRGEDGGDAHGDGGELQEGAVLPLRHAEVPLGSPPGAQDTATYNWATRAFTHLRGTGERRKGQH